MVREQFRQCRRPQSIPLECFSARWWWQHFGNSGGKTTRDPEAVTCKSNQLGALFKRQ
jgi:hypothetical protein